MNSFQYAIAKAAWQAHYEATNDAQPIDGGFDTLGANKKRAWLSAATAAIDKAAEWAAGRAQ
jgi:hypothetical protein